MKQWRFFYHYNKPAKQMSVHFKGKCYIGKDVDCYVPCSTHYNRRQPYLVMRGWAQSVHRNIQGVIIIN